MVRTRQEEDNRNLPSYLKDIVDLPHAEYIERMYTYKEKHRIEPETPSD